MNLAHHVRDQVARVNLRPTEGQKKAGNYSKGHIVIHGLPISIENPKGSWRSGTSLDGKTWRSRLPYHYGYIKRTRGADGDHVDVFVGPHLKSPHVFAIDQHRLHDRGFDEHKIMLGFATKEQARKAYIAAFSDGKGAKRIGHIEHMSIDAFKNWLRDGDTRKAIKRRADGGKVLSDEEVFGSAPMTDEQVFGKQSPPDAGKLDAALRGARAGATFNLGDEIEGARAAAPSWVPEVMPVGPVAIPARAMVGAARTGYGYLTGDKDITGAYERERDLARKNDAAAKANHPYVYAGSEIAGAVPAMAALPELGAAKALAPAARGIARFGARTLDAAVTGGEYGALSGAGEGKDTADRAVNAATGLVTGIIGGGAGNVAGETIGAAASRYGAPVVNTIRGWMNPEAEGARRVAGALRPDQEMIQAGTAKGMTVQQWLAARARGEPVTLADLGAGRTQALLRSAANTSPEGRAQLENTFEPRFHQQSERVADTVRNALPGAPANARKTADQIVAEYDAGRVPAYKQAYEQGDRPLMSPAMERLMGTDTFVAAMKRAISSGKDRDAVQGFGGFNPMVNVTEDGRIVFNKNARGIPTYPNLQYWDQVKRELDSVAKGARLNDPERADLAGQMSKILRTELDRQVPAYANARGIAEKYFGEDNALEAGRKLAGKKMDPEEVQSIMRQMKPDERALFQEGYASDLANRVIGSMKDTTNITKGNGLLQSPNERKMAAAIFGPGGVAQIQARMFLETIMDGARQAMGNSTTARQLIEAGLAGGAAGAVYGGGWDPSSIGQGMAYAAGSRLGASKLMSEEVKVGLKHMIGKVDAKTARRVAELLTSNDPRLLQQGYQMAAKSQAIMQGLQNLARRLAITGQTGASRTAAEGMKTISGIGARADEGDDRNRLYVSPQRGQQP
jgi:hypothetical protein